MGASSAAEVLPAQRFQLDQVVKDAKGKPIRIWGVEWGPSVKNGGKGWRYNVVTVLPPGADFRLAERYHVNEDQLLEWNK